MKKYISILFFICLSNMAWAQNEAQEQLDAYVSDGLVKWKSPDNKYSFRVGARVMMDGAHYFDEYTDRGSGVRFKEARLRVFSKLGNNIDFKFDVDLAHSGAVLKDVYLRWHPHQSGFIKVGNFIEPFSYENSQSSYDATFINKSATLDALQTGRTLGISYRHYHKYFWGEAGVFSQRYNALDTKGDMGYGLSTRLIGRYTTNDFAFHLGASFNHRRPNANGITNGSDDYNRYVEATSTLESPVDKTAILGGRINNVKHTFKMGFEGLLTYRQFMLKGEYIHAKHTREKDWEYNFRAIQGTIMATFAPTLEAFKKLYGEDTPVKQSGFYIQGNWLVIGGNYKYNTVDAHVDHPGKNSLELSFRYNRTDLNDLQGGMFMNGAFYESAMHAAFGIANGSFIGGKVDSYTVGVNYYPTSNIILKFNYVYQKLDHEYNYSYMMDKNLHSIMGRLAFEF